jgi:hypothetical protein
LCHRFLSSPTFLLLLLAIDRDLAEKVRSGGCPCGGRLHAANYPRKPRGGPQCPDPEISLRLSFCCDVDGCRCRSTPPSARFLGRKVYLGVMVVLITALRQGPTPKGYAELRDRFGADRRTIARWQTWWKKTFPVTRFWKAAKARFTRMSSPAELPHRLILLFKAESADRMAALLRFLSPLGGSRRFELQEI